MYKIWILSTVFSLFPTVLVAQDSLCYIEWRGQFIDLSNNLCDNKSPSSFRELTATTRRMIPLNNVRVSDIRIELSENGTPEIKGTLTNESNQVGELPIIQFNVIDQRNNRILASEAIALDSSNGIAPGEQMSFIKAINTNIFSNGVRLSDLQVKIANSI
ncbi:hypothetical protein Glo7428_0428 [Gloeocapsa sp. PCC 7428]|uniref:hypothetical protein n=1 Tax=Gloeocapsa sp. PCC 7428 TaxID=1173026 RepID=UPI0002A60696|nr:hypothetical protein [Gloeocapsa sp. PCC 7428]AFZ29029.1 hypothetical protein Glo7428_0428 [Gloeocapsa sp. PCC 7428]